MADIGTIADLEAIYGAPSEAARVKVAGRITPAYRAMIEASPFVALATAGPEGLDCSPRGDAAGRLVHIEDERTLLMPDRRGNNRVDSLRNIVRDPRVALLFLLPGSGSTLRLNGRAAVNADPALLARFAVDGQAPRSVIRIAVEEVYFQCSRAILRSELWNPEKHLAEGALPTAGQMLAQMTEGRAGGPDYDAAWPARAKASMW